MPKSRKKSVVKKVVKIAIFTILFLAFLLLVSYFYFENRSKEYQKSISSFYTPVEISESQKPGEILKIEKIDTALINGDAYRFMYVSELPSGVKVPVTGNIYVSKNKGENKNVVAWAHGTVGLGEECAPSRRSNPTLIMEPWLTMMMDKGWIVVATDYYGLGMSGAHQYLVGESEARDVINSIRAVKNIDEFMAGENVAIFGHSQGGHSVLFSAEKISNYAPEIDLKGVVAAAPATELNFLLSKQFDKPLTKIIAPEIYLSWVDKYNLPTDIINPKFTKEKNIRIANQCIVKFTALKLLATNLNSQYFLKDPSLNEKWSNAMTLESPKPQTKYPVMISQGLKDTVVLPEVTEVFVEKSCDTGTKLTTLWLENITHNELPAVTSVETVNWINDRFENKAQRISCKDRVEDLN